MTKRHVNTRSRSTVVRTYGGLLFALLTLVSLSVVCSGLQGAEAASPSPQPAYRSFSFSQVIQVTPPVGSRRVRIRIPVPSSNPYQIISQLQVDAPTKVRVHDGSKDGEGYADLTIDSSHLAIPIEVRLSFHVFRYERIVDVASIDDTLSAYPKDVRAFLLPDSFTPDDAPSVALARERALEVQNPLDRVQRIYECLVARTGGDPSHDEQNDLAFAFVHIVREMGIPARVVMGFWLPRQKAGTVSGYHSWAEFYVNGAGWVPVDFARTRSDWRTRESLFGGVDADRVALSTLRTASTTEDHGTSEVDRQCPARIEVNGRTYTRYSTAFFFQDTSTSTAGTGKRPIFAEILFPKAATPQFPRS